LAGQLSAGGGPDRQGGRDGLLRHQDPTDEHDRQTCYRHSSGVVVD